MFYEFFQTNLYDMPCGIRLYPWWTQKVGENNRKVDDKKDEKNQQSTKRN